MQVRTDQALHILQGCTLDSILLVNESRKCCIMALVAVNLMLKMSVAFIIYLYLLYCNQYENQDCSNLLAPV